MKTAAPASVADTSYPVYRWVVLAAWILPHVWGFVVMESIGFLLPSMKEELGLSPIQEGLIGAAPRIGSMILAIPFGWLLSRMRPKLLTSLSLFIGALLIFFQGWAPFFFYLFLGRLLFGIASIAREPARALLMRQWVPPKEVVIVNALMSFLFGIVAIGFILTPIILEWLDNSWRDTFYLYGALSLGLAVLWQVLGKERHTVTFEEEMKSQIRNPLRSIMKYKDLWTVGLMMGGTSVTWTAFATFWPGYMEDTYDMSLTTVGYIIGTGGLVSSVAGVGVALLVVYSGRKRQVLLLTGLLLVGPHIVMLWTGSVPILIGVQLIAGLGWAFYPVAMTVPFELSRIKPREIAVAIGFMETLTWIGMFIGPLLAGGIEEVTDDRRLALFVCSFFVLTLTFGGLLLPRSWDKPVQEIQPAHA